MRAAGPPRPRVARSPRSALPARPPQRVARLLQQRAGHPGKTAAQAVHQPRHLTVLLGPPRPGVQPLPDELLRLPGNPGLNADLLDPHPRRYAHADAGQSGRGVLGEDQPQPGRHRGHQVAQQAERRGVRVLEVLHDQHGVADRRQESLDRAGQQPAPHLGVGRRRGRWRQPVGELGYDEPHDSGQGRQCSAGSADRSVRQSRQSVGDGPQRRRVHHVGTDPAQVCPPGTLCSAEYLVHQPGDAGTGFPSDHHDAGPVPQRPPQPPCLLDPSDESAAGDLRAVFRLGTSCFHGSASRRPLVPAPRTGARRPGPALRPDHGLRCARGLPRRTPGPQ